MKSFSDSEVHTVLSNSGVKKKIFDIENKANEWYVTDLETAKNAIKAVKEGKEALHSSQVSKNKSPIVFRPNRRKQLIKLKASKKGKEMLWLPNEICKTLTALQVVKDFNFGRTIILTHRPVVDKGWFEDLVKFSMTA